MFDRIKAGLAATLWRLRHKEHVNQMAALCHRQIGDEKEVLLVTSSEGRWILPKGWPMKGKNGAQTAAQEAWEEAGVKAAEVSDEPLALYQTVKRKSDGTELPCETEVYTVEVAKLADTFPEHKRRKRRWVSVSKALKLVEDPGLRRVLRTFRNA